MRRNKKTKAGRRERLQALARLPMAWRRGLGSIMAASGRARPRRPFGSDDLLDAAVLVWTAWRIWQGRAVRLPADPPTDRRGLRMEIWY